MPEPERSRTTVLITGASSGLGLALARELLATEYHLILTARESSLPRFPAAGIAESPRIWLRALDVTDPAQRREVIAEAEGRRGGVDILVNNAGVAYRSVVEHVVEADRRSQMDVNFESPMALIRLVLPGMRRRHPPLRLQVTLDAHLFSLLRRVLPRSLYHHVLYHALPGVRRWGR